MTDLSRAREELFATNDAKRVVIKCKTKQLNSENYRASVNELVSEIFPEWEIDSRILFLAIDIWSERSFIVIDLNHHDYNYDTAHHCQKVLPVYVLQQQGRSRRWALTRWPQEDKSLMMQLADLHNVNGYDVAIPFLEDHTRPLFHANPREFPSGNNIAQAGRPTV